MFVKEMENKGRKRGRRGGFWKVRGGREKERKKERKKEKKKERMKKRERVKE